MKSFALKSLQTVFSLAYWIIAFVWMLILALLTFILLPIFPYRKSHNWIAAPGFALCVRMTLSKFKIICDPKFDPKRLSVFCQNHVNLLDAHVASAAIPHTFCGLMHAWQFHIPFYGWLMRMSKGIPIEKKRSGNVIEQITKAAMNRKLEGFSILTFPEGHRTLDGKVGKFYRGVFFMARDAGYPVVPLAVKGSFDVNQKGTWLFKPGEITVYVGEQIETHGLSDEEIGALTTRVQKIVSDFVEHGCLPTSHPNGFESNERKAEAA